MKALAILILTLPALLPALAELPRLAVLTDIGGDPDDQQSMVRLMAYANEIEIELLLASAAGTPGELKEAVTKPGLILAIIKGYQKVLPHLRKHAEGWPDADALRSRVKSGNPHRGRENIGAGCDSDGSLELVKLVDAGSARRPLNVTIWGGQTDLAQALWRVKHDRGADGLAAFVKKVRVYDINDQDHIADWMRTEFPGLCYILAKAPAGHDKREGVYRGMYLTGDESLTSREWIEANVHSLNPLGSLYPMKTANKPNPFGCMKEGDTPSWFFFLSLGGNDPDNPAKPGWGGQFQKEPDGWWRDVPAKEGSDPRTTVSRWREQFQADFAKRMRWCTE